METRMFSPDSFTDEIETKADADSCTKYFASNELTFRSELQNEGLSYDEIQDTLRKLWGNLIASSKRVGYTSGVLRNKISQFS
jgi:hypothetical protein